MMSPTFIRMLEFDTEHTRFASKYNLFVYREEGVDPYTQDNIGVWWPGLDACAWILVLTRVFS